MRSPRTLMPALPLRPVTVAGVRGSYAVVGDAAAPPVLLLPSAAARVVPYRTTIAALARDNRVYAVEPPGVGGSARLREPWAFADYANWAAGFMDWAGITGATVIGHSHGGGVAALLSVLHPGRAGRIVLVDSVGAGGPLPLLGTVLGRFADVATVEGKLTVKGWKYIAQTAAAHWGNFCRQTQLALSADLTPVAPEVTVPVLLAWGRRDHTIPPRRAWQLARRLPDVSVYISPRGSHCWLITHAEEFAAVIKTWTRQNGQLGGKRPRQNPLSAA
jgi:pimeloyl-ACP methyl ester carboxylesterase